MNVLLLLPDKLVANYRISFFKRFWFGLTIVIPLGGTAIAYRYRAHKKH